MVKATGDLITADDWNDLAVVPVGAILAWSVNAAPSGWLLCAGQAVSRSEYADLFAIIGTTYGAGDGGSTFNLPDLRGRFPLGKDNMGGTSANRVTAAAADNLNGSGGAETHTLTGNEMPSHSHIERGWYGSGFGSLYTQGTDPKQAHHKTLVGVDGPWTNGTVNVNAFLTTASSGGGQAHNNMPPYLALNYIIKA